MLETKELLIQSNQRVAELNRVPGFDPVKLLQRAIQDGDGVSSHVQLILKYKKLWFRLACPHGRIRVTALRLTEQMAIVQAEIYRDKDDPKPISNFVSRRTIHNTPGGLYIQAAEYEAVDNALTDAGFGIQLCDICTAWGEEAYVPAQGTGEDGGTQQSNPVPSNGVDLEWKTEQAVEAPSMSGSAEEIQPKAPTSPADTGMIAQLEPQGKELVSLPEEMDIASSDVTAVLEPQEDNNPESAQEKYEQDEQQPDDTPMNSGTVAPVLEVSARTPEQDVSDIRLDETAQDPTEQIIQPNLAEGDPESPASVSDDVSELEEDNSGEMTLEEARNMIADVGSCRGKTLAQIADRRPTTLRWYFTTCPDSSEQLKKAARLVFESLNLQRSA